MIRIGTRDNILAIKQAEHLSFSLRAYDQDTEIKPIPNNSLDPNNNDPLIDALLNHRIDVISKPLKHLSVNPLADIVIAGVSERAAVNDVLIIKKESSDTQSRLSLKSKPTIGVSAIRRKSLLKKWIPEATIVDLNGSIQEKVEQFRSDTRLDAIILAKISIERLQLDLSDFVIHDLNPLEFIPDPAQGVLAFQCRKNDIETRKLLKYIHYPEVSKITNIERSVLKSFNNEHPFALGMYCVHDANNFYHCYGMYARNEESTPIFHRISQSTTHKLAERMYEALTYNNN